MTDPRYCLFALGASRAWGEAVAAHPGMPLEPVQQLGEAGGHGLAQRAQLSTAAGGDDLGHLAGQVGADAGNRIELLAAHLGHAAAQLAESAGGVATGADAERVGALNFQQVGHLVDHRGDVGVAHRHGAILGAPPMRV